jgi:hypothetical protein
MKKHKNLTNGLHYLFAFHTKPRIHTNPFHKLSKSFLGWWFISNGNVKLRVEKAIKRGKVLTITK